VKEFVIYTALRILLFVASLGVVVGVWFLFDPTVPLVIAFLIALVVSGVGSYFLLSRYRERFAVVVERRAERATAAFEEMKAKEDAD
jgi:predicted PurR-regulated permease PerM